MASLNLEKQVLLNQIKAPKKQEEDLLKKPKYKFSYSTSRLPRCCGVYEVGDFNTIQTTKKKLDETEKYYGKVYVRGHKDSVKEAHEYALKEILTDKEGFSIQFWFYKTADYKGDFSNSRYTEDDFRQVVEAHPNCTKLAEYVNPNSNNMICGYMILNNVTTKAKHDEEFDDDED